MGSKRDIRRSGVTTVDGPFGLTVSKKVDVGHSWLSHGEAVGLERSDKIRWGEARRG